MRRIFVVLLMTLFCDLAFVRPTLRAQDGSDYVSGVPQCGKEVYDNNMFVVENACDIEVSITWTSPGNVWGRADGIGPGGHQGTGESRNDVNKAGGVSLYTCPGRSSPRDDQNRPIGSHYKGPYRCHR
jgi:hypothetical protein